MERPDTPGTSITPDELIEQLLTSKREDTMNLSVARALIRKYENYAQATESYISHLEVERDQLRATSVQAD